MKMLGFHSNRQLFIVVYEYKVLEFKDTSFCVPVHLE